GVRTRRSAGVFDRTLRPATVETQGVARADLRQLEADAAEDGVAVLLVHSLKAESRLQLMNRTADLRIAPGLIDADIGDDVRHEFGGVVIVAELRCVGESSIIHDRVTTRGRIFDRDRRRDAAAEL